MRKTTSLLVLFFLFLKIGWAQNGFLPSQLGDGNTFDGPGAQMHWYKMTMPASSHRFVEVNGSNQLQGSLAAEAVTKDPTVGAFLFAFVGNETEGYTIYNKQKGKDYVLCASGMENGATVSMKNADKNHSVWKIGQNHDGLYIQNKTAENACLNLYEGKNPLKIWNNGSAKSDNGSRFVFHGDDLSTMVLPQSGKRYYIAVDHRQGKQYLLDGGGSWGLTTDFDHQQHYKELVWECVESGGKYAFRNLATGHYFNWNAMGTTPLYWNLKKFNEVKNFGNVAFYNESAGVQRFFVLTVEGNGFKWDQADKGFNTNSSCSDIALKECNLSDEALTINDGSEFVSHQYGEKWVHLTFHNDGSYSAGLDNNAIAGTAGRCEPKDFTADDQLWCLVGSVNTGFRMYNKASGNQVALHVESTNEEAEAKLKNEACLWNFVKKGSSFAIVPNQNKEMALNAYGGLGSGAAHLKLYPATDNGGWWKPALVDVSRPLSLTISVTGQQPFATNTRVADMAFSIPYPEVDLSQTLAHESGTKVYYLPNGQFSLSMFTYRGYIFEGFVDANGNRTEHYDHQQIPAGGMNLEARFDVDGNNTSQYLFYDPLGKGVPYRIPAIATTKDGHVLAVADYRVCKADIGHGEVDMVLRRSSAAGMFWDGKSWTEKLTIADGQGGNQNVFNVGFGDAAMVADQTTGEVLIMAVAGKQVFSGGSLTSHNSMARIISKDNGLTWQAPEDLTAQFMGKGSLFEDGKTMFFGSGALCQSKIVKKGSHYRVYGALLLKDKGDFVVYSDDFGATWHILGDAANSCCPGGNEPKVTELSNGDIVLSSRKSGGRYFNIYKYSDSHYESGLWNTAVSSNDGEGVANGISFGGNSTNGEILPVEAMKNGVKKQLMLQSVPTGGNRSKVSIFFKEIDNTANYTPVAFASGWTKGMEVSNLRSAYSAMTVLPNGNIGIFYEEEPGSLPVETYCLVYRELTISEITKEAYSKVLTPQDNVEIAENVLKMKGVGYPAANSLVRRELKSAIESARQNPIVANIVNLEAKVLAFKQEQNDIQLPEEGKVYTFRAVTKDGSKNWYLKTTDGTTVSTTPNAVEAERFYCQIRGNGKYSFINNRGKYLMCFNSKSTKELNPTYSENTCAILVKKLKHEHQVDEMSAENYFGYVYLVAKRPNDTSMDGCLILQSADGQFNVSKTPYFQDNFTSAFLMTEVAAPMPQESRFYRIKDVNGRYLQDRTIPANRGLNKIEISETNEAGSLYLFINHHLLNYNNGTYIGLNGKQNVQDAFGFERVGEIEANISEITPLLAIHADQFRFNIRSGNDSENGYTYLHSNQAEGKYFLDKCGTNNCGNPHIFDFEPATSLPVRLEADATGAFATLYTPVALQCPEGISAYTGVMEKGVLKLSLIERGLIPAGTGVLLKAAVGKAGIQQLTIVEEAPALTVRNDFVGIYAAEKGETGKNYYVLEKGAANTGQANTFAFYTHTGDASQDIAGFRARLVKPNTPEAAHTLRMIFEDSDEYPDVTPVGDYSLVAGITASTDYTRADRHLDGVALQSVEGNQRITFSTPRKVYTLCLDRMFTVKVGATVTATFDYSTDWMNGYIYIDRNNDGQFGTTLGDEVMAYSHLGGKDSKGKNADGSKVNPPSFTLPAEMTPGIYRMRYKVDWDWIDPAGKGEGNNKTLDNGGAFCDVLVNVHGDNCKVKVVPAENGTMEVPATSAFGKRLVVRVNAASGFMCKQVTVRHGYCLEGDQFVHGNRQYVEEVLPGYLVKDGQLVVPSEMMDGDVKLIPVFTAANVPEGNAYAVFDKNAVRNHESRILRSVTFDALRGGVSLMTLPEGNNHVYQELTQQYVPVVAGDVIKVSTDFVGSGLHAYLYVDLNEDGQFTSDLSADGCPTIGSELLSYTYFKGKNSKGETIADKTTVSMDQLPSFGLSEFLTDGNYRARLVIADDDVAAAGSANLVNEGGYVVDFLLNVSSGTCPLTLKSFNGNIYGTNNSALPMTIQPFHEDLVLVPTPVATGYRAQNMNIRVGHRLEGPAVDVNGNRQWTELTASADKAYTLNKEQVSGGVVATVNFVKGDGAAYDLVFFDEFDGENGSQPDATKWQRSQRMNATWNRWVSKSEDVVYLRDGHLVTRAIRNPEKTAEDPGDMITGAIESRERFTWKWGKVECRAKANLHIGTFPAIWMMPENQGKGWPNDGEIDIFEAVNNDHKAFHTIHTTYSYATKNNGIGSNEYQNLDIYHTYGLEWSPTQLKFFVDGKLAWTYDKSTNSKDLEGGQWPFDNNFYLILNQSVGNSDGRGWAKAPDLNHTYEFLIDWVRVYQTPENRAKCELQTAIYDETKGCEEGHGVNQYTFNHEVLDEANRLFKESEDIQALQSATQLVKQGTVTLNQPAADHFYRIRCAEQTGKGNDMKYLQSTQTSGKQNLVSGENGKGVEATFLNTAEGLLSYTRGLYCGAETLQQVGLTAKATFSEARNGRRGQYNIQLGDQYIYGSEATLRGGQPDGRNGYNWWLEEVDKLQVTFKGNEKGYYATLYAPVALTVPAGVTAYVGKKGVDYVALTPITSVAPGTNAVIPAHTAVLLKLDDVNDVSKVKEFAIDYANELPALGKAQNNDFVGSVETEKANGHFYGFGFGKAEHQHEKTVGFYILDPSKNMKGFRARLERGVSQSNGLRLLFDDESTGIEEIDALISGKAIIYDMNGRRVKNPTKGIYIINGKKVYFK